MQKSDANDDTALAFYDKRQKWLDFVSERDGIGHAAFRVGYFLARRMNGKDQCCWFSVPEIAKRIGKSEGRRSVSTRTVSDGIGELEKQGVLVVVRRAGRPSTYFLRFPFE